MTEPRGYRFGCSYDCAISPSWPIPGPDDLVELVQLLWHGLRTVTKKVGKPRSYISNLPGIYADCFARATCSNLIRCLPPRALHSDDGDVTNGEQPTRRKHRALGSSRSWEALGTQVKVLECDKEELAVEDQIKHLGPELGDGHIRSRRRA